MYGMSVDKTKYDHYGDIITQVCCDAVYVLNKDNVDRFKFEDEKTKL